MRRLSVLVVDDDIDVLRALATELGTFADVVTATSVSAALAHVDASVFDVVVADLRLPERWGDELLAYVAARAPGTRRLLLTGDSDPRHTVRELLEHGVIEAFFRKPRAEGLLEAIRGLTAQAQEGPPAPTS